MQAASVFALSSILKRRREFYNKGETVFLKLRKSQSTHPHPRTAGMGLKDAEPGEGRPRVVLGRLARGAILRKASVTQGEGSCGNGPGYGRHWARSPSAADAWSAAPGVTSALDPVSGPTAKRQHLGAP